MMCCGTSWSLSKNVTVSWTWDTSTILPVLTTAPFIDDVLSSFRHAPYQTSVSTGICVSHTADCIYRQTSDRSQKTRHPTHSDSFLPLLFLLWQFSFFHLISYCFSIPTNPITQFGDSHFYHSNYYYCHYYYYYNYYKLSASASASASNRNLPTQPPNQN
jgi:hypothetical protein